MEETWNAYQISVKNVMETENLGDLGINGIIKIKWISKKLTVKM
jgi:hypothetical protein